LQAAVDSYVDAQKSGDARKLAFADKVRYLENMGEITPDKGLWNTALPIAYSNSILDGTRLVDECPSVATRRSRTISSQVSG
jgi:hypothetical protein